MQTEPWVLEEPPSEESWELDEVRVEDSPHYPLPAAPKTPSSKSDASCSGESKTPITFSQLEVLHPFLRHNFIHLSLKGI